MLHLCMATNDIRQKDLNKYLIAENSLNLSLC